MKQIAVCLQTCDRPEYTRRTVESFLDLNPNRDRFTLLHADDASVEPANLELAALSGFRTVVQHSARCGNLATRLSLIEAAKQFAPWMLLLENDCESVRPFPWEIFDYVAGLKKVYALRLFGEFKDAAGRQPCKRTHQWKGERAVKWTPLEGAPEPAEIADIHWSAQPTVTRVKSAIALHRKGKRELGQTVRVLENVFVHIGEERTRAAGAREAVAC